MWFSPDRETFLNLDKVRSIRFEIPEIPTLVCFYFDNGSSQSFKLSDAKLQELRRFHIDPQYCLMGDGPLTKDVLLQREREAGRAIQ
jgi:hypothetical protein